MPKVLENGIEVSYTPAEFAARERARLDKLNLPIDTDGRLYGNDTSISFTLTAGGVTKAHALDAGSLLIYGKAFTDFEASAHSSSEALVIAGLASEGLQTVKTKTYESSPSRSTDGSLSDINSIRTYLVPRVKINIAFLKADDYVRLCRIFNEYNEVYVIAYYKESNSWERWLMYPQENDPSAFFNTEAVVFGMKSYAVDLVATLNDVYVYENGNKATNSDGSYKTNDHSIVSGGVYTEDY